MKAISSDFGQLLALRYDGTLWVAIVRANNFNFSTHVAQLDDGVSQISGRLYLKENGELRQVMQNIGTITHRSELLATNVQSVAGDFFVTADGILHRILSPNATSVPSTEPLTTTPGLPNNGWERVFGNRNLAFMLNRNGQLFGVGANGRGSVGAGQVFDRGTFLDFEAVDPIITRPRFVMDNVANVYIRNAVFARDINGVLWTWGDAPTLPSLTLNREVVWQSDPMHYRPRISGLQEAPAVTYANGVNIRQDGILWISVSRWPAGDASPHNVEIQFPARVVGGRIVADNGATATAPPTGVTTPTGQQQGPSVWAIPHINAAIAAGLVPVSMLSLDYPSPITRAEFTALAIALYTTATNRTITGRMTFNDTTDPNVQMMGYLGVVGGVGDGNFNPNGQLTREQAAVMIVRLADIIGQPLPQSAPTFADNASISSWATAAVGQMQASGIMGGTGNNNFSPSGTFTREQSIITILRLFEFLD